MAHQVHERADSLLKGLSQAEVAVVALEKHVDVIAYATKDAKRCLDTAVSAVTEVLLRPTNESTESDLARAVVRIFTVLLHPQPKTFHTLIGVTIMSA